MRCQSSAAKRNIKQVTIMFPRLASFALSVVIALVLISNGATGAFAQNDNSKTNRPKSDNPQHPGKAAIGGADVARGKYIVESVAVCGQCHTPRDAKGNLDHTRWLQGSPVPWLPAKPDQNWPLSAPRIGGTPPASDADMIKLLTIGIWTTGNPLRLPMPQFRMDRSDAEAVVAYLKSLTPQP
jgi:mono/diheme cytochrome c family protein